MGYFASHDFLVPKLLLGNLSGCEALLRSGNGVPPHLGSAKRSLAGNCVPKQELGNEKVMVAQRLAWRRS